MTRAKGTLKINWDDLKRGAFDDPIIDDLRSFRAKYVCEWPTPPAPTLSPDPNGHHFEPYGSGFLCLNCHRHGTLAELTPVEKLGPCRPHFPAKQVTTSQAQPDRQDDFRLTIVPNLRVPEGEIWIGYDPGLSDFTKAITFTIPRISETR